MGILRPDAGEVRWRGHAVGEEERNAAARVAVEWLERLGLEARADERLVALSHGNQQRVQLAVALVHDPELLVLDEPFAGLDPEAVDSLSEVLRHQAVQGRSILFSSHQLELVERICRRVVIVEAGRVLAAGTLRELRERFPAQLRVKVARSSISGSNRPGSSTSTVRSCRDEPRRHRPANRRTRDLRAATRSGDQGDNRDHGAARRRGDHRPRADQGVLGADQDRARRRPSTSTRPNARAQRERAASSTSR